MLDGYQLLIPGPITLEPSVLQEMVHPIVPHYGAAWTAYYRETLECLRQVFRTSGPVFAIPGSGSAGLEAAISSCLQPEDGLLILANGFFGERLVEIAKSRHANTTVERLPVNESIAPQTLRHALEQIEGIKAVLVVHSESSSGLLNPIESLGAVCREHGVMLIVDAISSLGGIELDMERMNIDVCISASQKCLEGPPGLGLVAVRSCVWERIRAYKTPGWFLSLQNWKRYEEMWGDWHPHPVTMPIPAFRALRMGLERVLEEGMEARWRRHADMARWLLEQTSPLGYLPVFPEGVASPTVVALKPPKGMTADAVVSRLRDEYKLLIAGGMGDYKDVAFRVGNMGPQSSIASLKPLVTALGHLSRDSQIES